MPPPVEQPITRLEILEAVEKTIRQMEWLGREPARSMFPDNARQLRIWQALSLKLRMDENWR